MSQKIRYVGLDVHKDTITIAVADEGRAEAKSLATIPSEFSVLLKHLKRLGTPESLRCCYEAGPTGFGVCRDLQAEGIACVVIAPSLVPVQSGNRVKTDRRDARKLAHYHRSGDLTAIHVPDEATEALRDLERTRDDAKKSERVARSQLLKFLLRRGPRYAGKTNWTQKHLEWVRTQKFEHEAQQRVLVDYLHTVEEATERVERLTNDIQELVESWSLAPLVKALQAFRGIRLVISAGLAAEIADFRRFKSASQFMSFVGLVPSEHSTGDSKRQGRITRTGNAHVRRFLVEAAWSYRFEARMSPALRERNKGVAPEVSKIAWKAQKRLNQKYRRLLAKGKPAQQVIVAIARELAGFIWAAAQQPKLLAN